MRLFLGSLATETNTFSPIPTDLALFEEQGLLRGDASRRPGEAIYAPVFALWRAAAEAAGHDVRESLCAFATPAGRVVRCVYEALREELLEDLRAALPVDVVLLALHGAMVADGYEDCEGDLLERVRALVGPRTVIGAELDLHCHLTRAMLGAANLLIAFKHYPHTDGGERARELLALALRGAQGEIRPVTRAFDLGLLGVWRTTREPAAGLVRLMEAMERRPGVLSVSFGHGFPWADVPDVGARVWAITDGDPALAERLARELAEAVDATRESSRSPAIPIDAALDELATLPPGLVVFADLADNAGGGAPSDSTFVLERLLAGGVRDVALGALWDPQAVAFCQAAGVGARLALRVGGKVAPISGSPVDLTVTVRSVLPDHRAPGLNGTSRLGTSVWVEAEGIDLVLNAARAQTFSPRVFEDHGIALAARRAVVVKSSEHFYAAFAPIASAVRYLQTPGTLHTEFERMAYTRRALDYWPRVAEPRRGPFP